MAFKVRLIWKMINGQLDKEYQIDHKKVAWGLGISLQLDSKGKVIGAFHPGVWKLESICSC